MGVRVFATYKGSDLAKLRIGNGRDMKRVPTSMTANAGS
jgi:hypothetical protein